MYFIFISSTWLCRRWMRGIRIYRKILSWTNCRAALLWQTTGWAYEHQLRITTPWSLPSAANREKPSDWFAYPSGHCTFAQNFSGFCWASSWMLHKPEPLGPREDLCPSRIGICYGVIPCELMLLYLTSFPVTTAFSSRPVSCFFRICDSH